MISREQATLLADLARTIRPAWDTRAIVPNVLEVGHKDIREVTWALLTVAADPKMLTPTSLTFEGDHWRRAAPPVPRHPHYTTTPTPELTERGREAIAAARAAIKREDQQ